MNMKIKTLNEPMPIMIAGGKAAGKSLLGSLLDGHSEIFVSPFHEMLINAFRLDGLNSNGFLDNDIELIKTKLACSGKYFQLEKKAQFREKEIGVADASSSLHFDFDFYAFDKSWAEELRHAGIEVSPEYVLGVVYRNFSHFIEAVASDYDTPCKKNRNFKYYACMSNSYPGAIRNFLRTFPNGRVVYVHRNLEESINGLVQRKPTMDPLSKHFTKRFLKEKYCSREFVREVALLEAEAVAAKADTQRVHVIEFQDFFKDLDLMDEVMGFLNLPVQTINYTPSHLGVSIKSITGIDLLRKPIDNAVNALSKEERRFIRKVASEIHL